MHNRFIALILASALAITGLSAPAARADPNNADKIIAGVTALAVIGALVANKDNDKKAKHYNRSRNWSDYDRHYLNGRKLYRQRHHDTRRVSQRRWRDRSYVSNCRVVHDARGRVISRHCSEPHRQRR